MTRHTIAALSILAVLAGCGAIRDSRVNPFNWFGKDRVETVDADAQYESQDNRPRVDQVVSVKVEQVTGGAILRAVGLPQTQGYYEAELVQLQSETRGLLDFGFRIVPPQQVIRQGTTASREVTVAKFLSTQDLNGVSRIRVQAARNARSVRR